ncbi:ribonucleoside-diphosphate reductase, adenosylcobalamin-dependent, partial [candidate division WWE3 bacterium RIFOXYD2_FULL_43_10]
MSSFLYREDESVFSRNTSIDFSENARKILEKRYLRRDANGDVSETPERMFERIADVMAAPDRPYTDAERSRTEFYNLLSSKKFFPNSPTFTGAGTPLGQLAACFVLPISDDLGKEKDGIFSTLRVASLIQQSGGGNGFSFSRLRPKGSRVAASNGIATGPVGFLKVYDVAFGEIAQGGVRRGANMGVLRIDHPDIREFIACKSVEGNVANFNLSVAITDRFMEAVKNDTTYDLIDPHTLKVTESPRAREIFDQIVDSAHRNGEPGVLFIDTANKENPVPHLYQLEATNPCGEQWLGPYENCCLGSINLAEHLTFDGKLDWEELRKSVVSATRFLDNVVEANKYIPAVPEIKEAAMDVRRIGLGFMALADVMYSLGIRYGSEEGQEFAAQVSEFIRYFSMKTSVE